MATIQKRTSNSGKITYTATIRLKGHPSETATFDRKTDAQKWVASIESAIKENRHFKTSESKKRTLEQLIEKYTKQVLPDKKDGLKQARQLQWWSKELGHLTLANISPSVIADARDKLLDEGRAPSTTMRYLAALSHALTIASNEWEWINENPMSKVRKPKEPKGRDRFLSDDERVRLLEACKASSSQFLYPIVVLAISTGMRQGEIVSLTWREIDLSRGYIYLSDTKNGEKRTVPLVGHALETIRELSKIRRIDTNYLFPSSVKADTPVFIRKQWQKALIVAEVENFRFHDLRHTAASYLAMNGASLTDIAEILGHKTLAMVRRYAHLTEQHTSKVLASMNEGIF